MERLSDAAIEIVNELHRERIDYSGEYLPLIDALGRLASYEDTGLEPDEVDQIRRAAQTMMFPTVADFVRYAIQNFEDLQKYRKAESEGRLFMPPCKIGDPVWRIKKGICAEKRTCIQGDICSEIIMGVCPDYAGKPTVERSTFRLCDYNDLGKTVFLYRDEAEEKLKESGGE